MHHILIILICIFIVFVLQKQHIQQIEAFENKSRINAYVINLDRNTERYNTFITICNKYMPNTQVERFSAVDGTIMTYDEIQNIVSDDVLKGIQNLDKTRVRIDDSQLTRGMIGCYMSHLNLYKKCLAIKEDIIMVFEDDAAFQIDIMKLINSLNEFPIDWDILLLGTVQIFDQVPYSDAWKRVNKFWGTHGYIINKNGMNKILQNSIPITKQIDHQMGYLSQQGLLNIYAYVDNVIIQNSRYSDVQMQVTKNT